MIDKKISVAVIGRLPRYYRYLGELIEENVDRISSGELSIRMKVTASQIRQDFNNFGGFGQQGYGYNVKYLYNEIGKILGIDKQHNIIMIGAGNLGTALANFPNFPKRGFNIKAIFDNDPAKIGKEINGIKILDISEMESFIAINDIQIAAILVPKTAAFDIAKRLQLCGIKAFWNFAHTDLDIKPEDGVVENVHLSESLMKLTYLASNMNTGKEQS